MQTSSCKCQKCPLQGQHSPPNIITQLSQGSYLEKAEILNYSFSVHLPLELTEGKPLLRGMVETFGGVNVTPSFGGWYSDTKGVVFEKINLAKSFTDLEGLKRHLPEMLGLVQAWGYHHREEAMGVEISGPPSGSSSLLIIPTA